MRPGLWTILVNLVSENKAVAYSIHVSHKHFQEVRMLKYANSLLNGMPTIYVWTYNSYIGVTVLVWLCISCLQRGLSSLCYLPGWLLLALHDVLSWFNSANSPTFDFIRRSLFSYFNGLIALPALRRNINVWQSWHSWHSKTGYVFLFPRGVTIYKAWKWFMIFLSILGESILKEACTGGVRLDVQAILLMQSVTKFMKSTFQFICPMIVG